MKIQKQKFNTIYITYKLFINLLSLTGTIIKMGNHYSLTKSVSKSQSYAPWYLDPNKLVTVAAVAVVDTAHLVVKSTVATYVPPNYNKMKVSQNISEIKNETAVYIKIFAVWIKDGSLTGPLSTITGITTGTALTHWFAEIRTNDPSVWYWAELNNHGISLKSCSSPQEVKKYGAKSCRNHDAQNFSPKMEKQCHRTLKEIKQWVQKSNHQYHLTLHNCQHWAEELFEWV